MTLIRTKQHWPLISAKSLNTICKFWILNKQIIALSHFSYAKKISAMSRGFRDQKEKPLDRAMWWIEWVIRNPNSNYMKSPVLKQGIIAGNCYDIIALVAFIIFLICFVIFKCLKYFLKCFLKNNIDQGRLNKKKRA